MRFIDNGNGAITDSETGLMWEKGEGPVLPWRAAIDRCRDLRLDRYSDWRLPALVELFALVDHGRSNPACDRVFGAASDGYWSSTTFQGGPTLAWGVSFSDGLVDADLKSSGYRVRAVRGGLTIRPFDGDNDAHRVAALETMLRDAWAIIANVGNGDWNLQTAEWQSAAELWRDKFNVSVLPELPRGTQC